MNDDKHLSVVFYRALSGVEPVREWLKDLPIADRQTLGRSLRLIEMGWPLGMPVCRPLGGRLWEVRSNLTSNRIARILFCAADGQMILLHGFIKKTQKTPPSELHIAVTRQKELKL